MMLRHKMNHSSNGSYSNATGSHLSPRSNQVMHVRTFMQSIDPSFRDNNEHNHNRNRNHRVLPSPSVAATTSTKPSSLPFFPDSSSFDERSTPLTRRKKPSQKHSSSFSSPSASSISSVSSSFPSPPQSNFFYPSNRLRLTTNSIGMTYPRKTLFFSPTRTMAGSAASQTTAHRTTTSATTTTTTSTTSTPKNNKNPKRKLEHDHSYDRRTRGSPYQTPLPKEDSRFTPTNGVLFPQDNTIKINGSEHSMNHVINNTNNTTNGHFDPQLSSKKHNPVDVYYSPVSDKGLSPFLLQTLRSLEPGLQMTMRTPTRQGLVSTPPGRIGLVDGTAKEGTTKTSAAVATTATTSTTADMDNTAVEIDTKPFPSFDTPVSPQPTNESTACTPKRVGIDSRSKSPGTPPDSGGTKKRCAPRSDHTPANDDDDRGPPSRAPLVPAPELCPQPSVGTTMAASALVAMMVMAVSPKRGRSHAGCGSPTAKKHRTTPVRLLSNYTDGRDPSASEERSQPSHTDKHDEEIRQPFSNPCYVENTYSPSRKPGGSVSDDWVGKHLGTSNRGSSSNCNNNNNNNNHETNKKNQLGRRTKRHESLGATTTPALLDGTTAIAETGGNRAPAAATATNSGHVKRVPRRFLDDPSLPVLKSGMRLSTATDRHELNSLHCFVRSDLLEVFIVEDDDYDAAVAASSSSTHRFKGSSLGRSYRSRRQRVGIRCVHCGGKPKCQRYGTTMSAFFPKSLQDIYRGVCTWQRIHFHACTHIPSVLKKHYKFLKDSDKTRGKKAHWVRSAHALGFRNVDEDRNGIVWVGADASSPAAPDAVSSGSGGDNSATTGERGLPGGTAGRCVRSRASSCDPVISLDLTSSVGDPAVEAGAEHHNHGEQNASIGRSSWGGKSGTW